MLVSAPRALPNSRVSQPSPTYSAYVGDGKWHRFGPQPAPSTRAASPRTAPHPAASEPVRTYNASLTEGR
jgi:hypothetical protein